MTPSSLPKQTAAGFILAANAIALGVYFGTKLAPGNAGLFLIRIFYLLAALAVLKSVFIWGEARGFPLRRENGRIHFAHLLRNLVMAGITIPMVLILSAPLSLIAFQLAR